MKHLHVISFQNPVPPDYGGVIDVYYKLKAMHDLGWNITLHAFNYKGRKETVPGFFTTADRVIFYPRPLQLADALRATPFIVASRKNPALLQNLLKDDDPILFEGLHTTAFLAHPSLSGRLKIVRAHNVEHDYYAGIASSEKSFMKKIFFRQEARKLRRYEKVLVNADIILPISMADRDYFTKEFPGSEIIHMPCFFDGHVSSEVPGKGDYVLYQGSLDVAENVEAVRMICGQIAAALPGIRFVVAGRNPSPAIRTMISACPNVELKENLASPEFDRLLSEARVNLLVTDQPTGIKLKLLHALCRGAYVVTNPDMVAGTGLDEFVEVGHNARELADLIEKNIGKPYAVHRRLPDMYDNHLNAQKLEQAILHRSGR